MDALECLKTRRSVRKFLPESISEMAIQEMIDAGRLAATARNVQPWEFIFVTNPDTRKKLADIMEYGKFIAEAPLCIVVLSKETKYFLEDGSAATENILLAAHALGYGACWVAGDKKDYAPDVCKLLGVPEGYRLISSIAVGKPATSSSPAPKRNLEEVIHREKF
jgi:nitroreductase